MNETSSLNKPVIKGKAYPAEDEFNPKSLGIKDQAFYLSGSGTRAKTAGRGGIRTLGKQEST